MIWDSESLPDDWNIAIIIPILKKGDKINCKNYLGNSLLKTVYKIFAMIVTRRLINLAEKVLREYQCGFRPERSTVDQIFAIKQSMEKSYEHSIDLHMLIIDFKQAFDSINRMTFPATFRNCKIPEKLTQIRIKTNDTRQ